MFSLLVAAILSPSVALALPTARNTAPHCQENFAELRWIDRIQELPLGITRRGRPVRAAQLQKGMRRTELVETMETTQAGPQTLLDSGGMGPCMAVALYDHVTKIALFGHFHAVSTDLDRMFAAAQNLFEEPARVEAYAVGGAYEPGQEESNVLSRRLRNRILNLVKRAGYAPENTFVRFAPDGQGTQFKLNPGTGAVELDIYDPYAGRNPVKPLPI